MLVFDAAVHARPAAALRQEPIVLAGESFAMLVLVPADDVPPLNVTFEAASQALEQLPRMFLEPDGAWVWRGDDEAGSWQLDGQLQERGSRLHAVELKGTCPRTALDQLLACLGWPRTPVVFRLRNEGVYLDEGEFRRWAVGGGR